MVTKSQQQLNPNEGRTVDPGERIVISGMSGLFPNSYNVNELSEVLYDKVNPIVKSDCWVNNHPEIAGHKGNVPDLEYFDAQFFKVHFRLSRNMDPTSRKMLEQAYQAIYDAGVNPESLSGKKIGVYVGSSDSETEKSLFYSSTTTGFAITGCSKTMFANRISYWLNAKGPSLSVDEACCSSTAAIELAYRAMTRGDCDAAIVGGSFVCLHPQTSVHHRRTIDISSDGKTKSFDKNATGCAMSEAVNILFLQKAKDALRIYGEVVHAKCEFTSLHESGSGPEYGFYRDPSESIKFLKTFYKEANVPPQAVQYVEAFGSATPNADKSELLAFDEVFCKTRDKPLAVGSVMSNIGYTKAATGITAVTKVLLGYHNGKLAANLHCESPREDVPALKEGRIKILQEHTEFDRTYAAVNSLSITGINGHVLLHGHYKPKDKNRYRTNIPRIVLLSGRQETSVKKIIKDLKSRPIDPEEHALLHNIHETKISGHLGRGFVILDTNDENETVCLCEVSDYFDQGKRPLWFVYSGMGSQWVGMGKELMRIPIFAAAIERCHRVLEPKGVNIVDIITSDDEKMFDNILHSFVGIAAMQIALTDVLRELNILPDKVIGHSLGEIGCAYADGCFTAEETILCAYYRGLVSVTTPLIRGSMAAVGLGYKEISNLCPPEIVVACHNSSESSTISGPAEIMREFVASLTSKGIFAKEVPCSNIAYHSPYIADAAPAMLKHLSKLITSPKLRSERWVSTSVPQDKWDEPSAKYSSAEYHTNNLLNTVLFEENSKLIPPNAVLIEVAPHALLQAILKRSLPQSCRFLPLTRRGHPDSVYFFLEAIGRLSMEGYNLKVKALYPPVEFPVSTSTPMLSHLVEWAHHEKWDLFLFSSAHKKTAAATKYVISTHDDEHSYLKGHVIRGMNVYPYAAALVSVWDTLLMSLDLKPKTKSVQFHEVFLHSQPVLHKQRQLRLSVELHRGTGRFEVMNENSLIMQGFVDMNVDNTNKSMSLEMSDAHQNLSAEDVYQLLHARDFNYMNDFRSIHSVNDSLTEAEIEWKNNWITFLDGVIQLNLLRQKHNSISKLSSFKSLIIDTQKHDEVAMDETVALINARVFEEYNSTVCGGVVLENPKFQDLPVQYDDRVTVQILKHIPTHEKSNVEYYWPIDGEIDSGSDEMLKVVNNGDPNSLYWVKAVPDKSTGVDIKVLFAGINTVYANNLLGQNLIKEDLKNNIIDFSGISKTGTRVMGIVKGDTITSSITSNSELLWPVPSHWSLEDAATVPLAYSMAFYILYIKTQLSPTHSILVQGGAGALGQAIIAVALATGCEIFTTVSSSSKKQFLRKLFPQLKDDHILFARDTSFVDMVLSITKGKGCDIVISCVRDELKNFSLKCLAFNGLLFDTTLIQTSEEYHFGMSYLTRQRGYVPVDFTSVFQSQYSSNAKYLQRLMSEGIARGFVRPLTRVTFAPQDAFRAFHLQAAHHNRGRVLLDLTDLRSNVLPRVTCSSYSWQLLISNNEILTLKLAERLIKRGAKKIILLLNNPSKCVDAQSRLWKDEGVQVKVISSNIWTESHLSSIVHSCKEDGGLESVLMVVSKEECANLNDISEKFTAIVRNTCVSLKYFALISMGDGSCSLQTSDPHGQVITRIKLPEVNTMHNNEMTRENNISLTINNAIDVLEKALCFKKSTIVVKMDSAPKLSLLHKLLKLADIRKEDLPEVITHDTKLNQLNIDHSKLLAIQTYLRDVYGVCLAMEDIKQLSIQSINELEKDCMGYDFVPSQGISSYFCNSDTNVLESTTDVVYLPTLSNSYIRDDEVDTTKTYLCIIPGVDGHHSRFHNMCERLKIPALVLQPGLDRTNDTVSELAKRYVNILIKKTELKNKFYLLGYESGVWVALEVAAILEEKGMTGTVYCLGGSPAEILENFKQNLSIYKTDEQLQMAVLKHIYSLMTNEETDILDVCKNLAWHEKVNICVNILRGKFPHSIQYAKNFIESAYARLKSVLQYSVESKLLKSQIISLRPRYTTEMDTSLQNYSHQKIITCQLEAPLSFATHDLMCASIINRFLDSKILEDFYNKSFCEIYYIDNDKIFKTSQ